jgi:dihydroorotate dehydrogenase
MKDIGDYHTINISCPNVGDARSFEYPKLLEPLLKKIQGIRKKEKIFLKISPEIKKEKLDVIIKLAEKYSINGFILCNLKKKRNGLKKDINLKFKGGISGKPMKEKSNDIIKYVFKKTRGKFVIIGCGGVFNGRDAYEKIKNGASLIQLITGMIYEGPSVIKKINEELVELLEKDGFRNIKEAIGKGVR